MITDEMIKEVAKRVRSLAPQLSKIDDEVVTTFAEDALLTASDDGFTGRRLVIAASFLAAHYSALADAKNSNVSKEQASILVREYFNRDGSTDYLSEYQRMLAKLDANNDQNIVNFF